jgi:UDP-N-acetylmuramyl pentapeptide phosphotransferase/UDP-N-acetylglucosamine-1-phosphate transferase
MELGSVIFFLSIIFNFFLLKNYKKLFLKKLADTEFYKPQAFHKFPAIRSGGLTILIFFLFFSIFYEDKNNYFFSLITLSSSFFLIGFLEDIKINLNPLIRLFFLLVISFLIIYYFDIKILNTQIEFLNNIINYNKFCSIFFVCLCLLFITNGSNFIDGFNGLLILQALIILVALYFVDIFNSNNLFLQNLILFFIFILLSVFFFNFPNPKIFLGDSGAYIVGVIL